jgi:signal transduction histidine kinase
MFSSIFKQVSLFTITILIIIAAATTYSFFILDQTKKVKDSVDFSSQKEFRNFSRAPARWERLARMIDQLNYVQDEQTFENAYIAIDVAKLRITILQGTDYSGYQLYYKNGGKSDGALSVEEIAIRFSHLTDLLKIIEDAVVDFEDGAHAMKDVSKELNEGEVIVQTIEATMSAYTLKTLDHQVEAVNHFFRMNLNLFLISIVTLLGLFSFAVYSSYQRRLLNAALIEVEQASKAKDAFLSNISHELRTPLNTITGMAHLVLDNVHTTDNRKIIEQINSSAQLLTRLVDDVLDFSKIYAQKLNLSMGVFDLCSLVESTNGLADGLLKYGCSFQLEHNLESPTLVTGDDMRLQQVLNNLISNACKFTEQGFITLRLDLEEIFPNHIKIRFAVSDTGIGVSKEIQSRLFQPFRQADDSTSRIYGGTGLGLTISQSLVNMMGGKIEIDSAQDQGSCFFFELIFEKAQIVQQASVDETGNQVNLDKVRVLLVEDNPINLKITSALLKKCGAMVHCAEDGFKACEIVSEIGIDNLDIILMDINMPKRDGHQTTRILLAQYGEKLPPVLALTAHAFDAERDRAAASGMVGFITKPIKPKKLYTEIERHIYKQF